jgi:hypothetical protein
MFPHSKKCLLLFPNDMEDSEEIAVSIVKLKLLYNIFLVNLLCFYILRIQFQIPIHMNYVPRL